ncbi:DNA polymerase-3 subunit beta [Bradyrhizobium sp. USDA 4341]
MKFTVEREAMLVAMGRISRIVERKNTIPILANVVLTAEGNKLTLRATDLDLQLTETIAAKITTSGTTTVPAHMTFDILKKLPNGSEVLFEHQDATLVAKSGRSRFKLLTLPTQDHPALEIGDMSVSFDLTGADLSSLLDRTHFAISTEETRYYLNGIYLHPVTEGNTKHLRAVATDGHRLAQTQVPCPTPATSMTGVIVPRKTVGELQKLVDGLEGDVTIDLSTQKIRVTAGDTIITSKLIDGTFPDYGRVVPANNTKVMVIDKRDFADAVDRVATVAPDKSRAVKLTLSDGRLIMVVDNPDSGAATEELDVDYGGEPLEIGFNSRYLLDITSELDGERAIVKFNDPGSPALVQSEGDSNSIYVLMPMRVAVTG